MGLSTRGEGGTCMLGSFGIGMDISCAFLLSQPFSYIRAAYESFVEMAYRWSGGRPGCEGLKRGRRWGEHEGSGLGRAGWRVGGDINV